MVLVLTGLTQIGAGIANLLICRDDAKNVTCNVLLNSAPCIKMTTPAYFGFAIIVITIFGFGCMGRRATAILLVLIIVCEFGLGLFILLMQTTHKSTIESSLVQRNVVCNVQQDQREQDTEFIACWENIKSNVPKCSSIEFDAEKFCRKNNTRLIDPDNAQLCANDLASDLTSILNIYQLTTSVLMITMTIFYMTAAVLLWWLQCRDSVLRGDITLSTLDLHANGVYKQPLMIKNEKEKTFKHTWLDDGC